MTPGRGRFTPMGIDRDSRHELCSRPRPSRLCLDGLCLFYRRASAAPAMGADGETGPVAMDGDAAGGPGPGTAAAPVGLILHPSDGRLFSLLSVPFPLLQPVGRPHGVSQSRPGRFRGGVGAYGFGLCVQAGLDVGSAVAVCAVVGLALGLWCWRRRCSASGARPFALPVFGIQELLWVHVGSMEPSLLGLMLVAAGKRRQLVGAVRRFGRRVTPWRTCRTSPGSVRTGKASPR